MTVLIIVASLLAVGCGSEASRAYVQRMLSLISGGEVSITISGNVNNIRIISTEEKKIYRKIEENLGVSPLVWTYVPDSMVLEDYKIAEETHSCTILYKINNKPMTVQMYNNAQEDSKVAKFDGEVINEVRIETADIEASIWQLNSWKDNKAYVTQFEFDDGYYIITGELDDEIFTKIIKSIKFYNDGVNA